LYTVRRYSHLHRPGGRVPDGTARDVLLPVSQCTGYLRSLYLNQSINQLVNQQGCRCSQGDHLSGKPGNVREFDSCYGNVRDFTESQGNVREKILSGKVAYNCLLLAAYLHPFLSLLSLCISLWFRIMHCCIRTPTTDNNTSTGMIWVALNVGSSAGNRHGIVRELHIVWRVVTLYSMSSEPTNMISSAHHLTAKPNANLSITSILLLIICSYTHRWEIPQHNTTTTTVSSSSS